MSNTTIEIQLKELHRLKDTEQTLVSILMDDSKYTHLYLDKGKIIFYDNRDTDLMDNIRELESLKEAIRKVREA